MSSGSTENPGLADVEELNNELMKTIERAEKNAELFIEVCNTCGLDPDEGITDIRKLIESCAVEGAELKATLKATGKMVKEFKKLENPTVEDVDKIMESHFEKEKAKSNNEIDFILDGFDEKMSQCKTDLSHSIHVTTQKGASCDPWTKQDIKVPVRSTICGHVYEKSSAEMFLSKKPMKCPYVGCPKMLSKQDIVFKQ